LELLNYIHLYFLKNNLGNGRRLFGSNCVLIMIAPKIRNRTSRSLYVSTSGVLGSRGHALQLPIFKKILSLKLVSGVILGAIYTKTKVET
jgi:hypothetical protein